MQHVRRAAVLALSTAAHNKPSLIKGLLPELLPLLYDQTVVKVTIQCIYLIQIWTSFWHFCMLIIHAARVNKNSGPWSI